MMMVMVVTEAKLTAGSKSFRGSAALNITYLTLSFCAVLSSAPLAMQHEAVPADALSTEGSAWITLSKAGVG